jgi:hypothetical protein
VLVVANQKVVNFGGIASGVAEDVELRERAVGLGGFETKRQVFTKKVPFEAGVYSLAKKQRSCTVSGNTTQAARIESLNEARVPVDELGVVHLDTTFDFKPVNESTGCELAN